MKDCSPRNPRREVLGAMEKKRPLTKILEEWRREKVCGRLEKVARLNKRRKVVVLQLGPWTS